MSQIHAMKQIGARNLGFRIELMKWSNKMDLLSIANEKSEVIVQRINWQKICVKTSQSENIKVRAISWQPDENIIAVAYSNGKVCLLDVEKNEEIYSFELESGVKTMHWTKPILNFDSHNSYKFKDTNNDENYLPPLPNLSSMSSAARKTTVNFTKGESSFLVVSLETGEICLSVLGVLPCGTIDIKKYVNNPNDFEIFDVRMAATLNEIIAFIRDGEQMCVLIFQNSILLKHITPLLHLAKKHGHILETLNYINDTIQCIIEAWETVLLEMDNKLTKYANSQPEGSMSADFLELLMFGVPSPGLEQFLTRDLTEKGLKKLGTSIELSYSTIQNLIVKPLHSAAMNLFYHLNALKGLSHNTYFYKDLIEKNATEKSIQNAGSFLIKIFELQQTIDQSATDYKIFWCWLSVVIVRLMNEEVGDDIAAVTQEDIKYLAEFLNNFDECIFEKDDGVKIKRKFNLERVSQYLENTNINFPQNTDVSHQWNRLLNENECLKNSSLIFPHHADHSLIQEQNFLKESIREMFKKPNVSISESFSLKSKLICGTLPPQRLIQTSYFLNKTKNSDLMVVSLNETEIILIELNSAKNLIKSVKLNLVNSMFTPARRMKLFDKVTIKDLQFYSESILSLLLQGVTDEGKLINYFVQLQIESEIDKVIASEITNEINLENNWDQINILDVLEPNYFKPIEGQCIAIAVSGYRKVSSILSDNCRKIRLYEMEIEDDDDEAEMSQNPILDNSKDSVVSQE